MNLKPDNQIILYEHKVFFNDLIFLYKKDRLPNKILFSGEKGIGKSTIAYHLINFILSLDEEFKYDLENNTINPQNKSFKLVQNKSNPNLHLIDLIEDKKNIDINQIRNLISNLNKSSFNLKPRFVLIDNIELLNINSVNALLKILEEPNKNINFILINNNKTVLPTIKSRCLDFKIKLNCKKSIEVINKLLGYDILKTLNKEFISNYITPGQLLRLLNFSNDTGIDLKGFNLKDLITLIIQDKYYKKSVSVKDLTYNLIELYFRSTISATNIEFINLYNIFIKKINNTEKFNLDEESLFMEFESKVLNG